MAEGERTELSVEDRLLAEQYIRERRITDLFQVFDVFLLLLLQNTAFDHRT